ncbi:MAG TPA: kelch repeat-containing protein [Gemmataceae bacterium]|nr:kelch repeat-containing protein [Gemmataceae bacterium]
MSKLWEPLGSLGATRVGTTATLLLTGKVLVVGGFGSQGSPDDYVELYDPATGTWSPAGPTNVFHAEHTATLLKNGWVLVVGGFDGNVKKIKTAELYDPATDTWTLTAPLAHARVRHSATLLRNGRVLIAGGEGSAGTLTSCELFKPSTGTWSATGALHETRSNHTATRLPNGKVLAAGGETSKSAELYNPSTATWSLTSPTKSVRYFGHTATLLRTGQVLVVGGYNQNGVNGGHQATAEVFDPVAGTWKLISSLAKARGNHTATLLPNGDVIIAGGDTTGPDLDDRKTEIYRVKQNTWEAGPSLNKARLAPAAPLLPEGRVLAAGGKWNPAAPTLTEIYNPVNLAEWKNTGEMATRRRYHTATPLPGGSVLITGGQNEALQTVGTCELYNPASGVFQATGSLAVARQNHTATLLPSGKVLVAGGATGSPNPTYELATALYDPTSGSWTPGGSLTTGREGHTATLLADGNVLVAGGSNGGGLLTSCEVYDPAADTWSPVPSPLGTGRSHHTATLLADGKVLVVGGNSGVTTAEVYDPAGGTWSPTGPLAADHGTGFTATLLPRATVLVAGGAVGGTYLGAAELYNPTTNGWSTTTSLKRARAEHTATVLPSGRVLLAGGNAEPEGQGGASAFTEEYDPATATFHETELIPPRAQATATLLPSGKVLLAGGNDNYYLAPSPPDVIAQAILYDEGRGAPASARPVLNALSASSPGATITFSGSGFAPDHEGSSGQSHTSSPTNYPLLMLEREGNEARACATITLWGFAFFGSEFATAILPATLQPGWHWARVVVNGIVSASQPILIQ